MNEFEEGAGGPDTTGSPAETPIPIGATSVAAPHRPPRPRQVTTAAVLLVLLGLLGVFGTWLLLSLANNAVKQGHVVSPAVHQFGYIQFALSGALIASGLLVWLGKPWGRILAIVLCSVNVLGGVIALFRGLPYMIIIGILLNISLIRTLSQDTVKDWSGTALR
jgi:hypothetical protein